MLESFIPYDLLRGFVIFASFVLFGLLFKLVWGRFITHIIIRFSKEGLNGNIVKSITTPMMFVLFAVGLFLGVRELPFAENYQDIVYGSFFVLFVLLSSVIVSKLLMGFIDKWLEYTRHYTRIPQLINKFIMIVVYLAAGFLILIHFEVEITPLIATLGVGGLAIGLALQKTLGDFFSGVHIISDRPVRVADFIQLESGLKGYVDDIGWRSTRIMTISGNTVIVPNSKLAESIVTNTNLPANGENIVVECGVSYDSDLEKVEKVALKSAKKVQSSVSGASADFEPLVRFNKFGDSNIMFSTILRVDSYVDRYLVQHEFIKDLKKSFDKKKIEISWPVRKVYMSKKKV